MFITLTPKKNPLSQNDFTWLPVWPVADDLDSGCLHLLQSPLQSSAEEAIDVETEEDYVLALQPKSNRS